MINVNFALLLKELRSQHDLSIEDFVARLDPFGRGFRCSAEHFLAIESGEDKISTAKISTICDVFSLDENSFYQGKLEPSKPKLTPAELLEEVEPGGLGSTEQRSVRLLNHEQISEDTFRYILGIEQAYDVDNFPIVKNTGCTCPGCRAYIEKFRGQ